MLAVPTRGFPVPITPDPEAAMREAEEIAAAARLSTDPTADPELAAMAEAALTRRQAQDAASGNG